MFPRLLTSIRRSLSRSPRRPARPVRPQVEYLEAREVPAVTYHGGAVLSNVRVQALYLGSDWVTNSAYLSQSRTLDSFLGNLVNSSYMDMLGNAYGSRAVDSSGNVVPPGTAGATVTPPIGRGWFAGGAYMPWNIDKTQYLKDSTIRNDLFAALGAGMVLPPSQYSLGSDDLYVIYVEDNVAVQKDFQWDSTNGRYDNSIQDFLGYHTAFGLGGYSPLIQGYYSGDIHYLVIPYAGSSVPLASPPVSKPSNSQWSYLTTLNSMTDSTSHELAEAVTDPNINYAGKALGWNDDTASNEIGDVDNGRTVYLNNFAVQREADPNDQAMTPAGATAVTPVNFVLAGNGNLYVGSGSGLTYIPTYAKLNDMSDQGIDNYGHAMIDIVLTDGSAWEYHAGFSNPWVFLDTGVKTAKAGQGNSYLLYTSGNVREYMDWAPNAYPAASRTPNTFTGQWYNIDTSGGVVSIDAGTDRYGVSMMTEVWSYDPWSYTFGYEVSDSTGWNEVDNGNYTVKTLSAGQMGNIGILYKSGVAIWLYGATGNTWLEGQNVIQFTMGTDENGNVQFDMLFNNGNVSQWSWTDGWTSASGAQWVGKPHEGVEDVIFNPFYAKAYYASAQDWGVLYNGAVQAA
jgi:hypothetical protein